MFHALGHPLAPRVLLALGVLFSGCNLGDAGSIYVDRGGYRAALATPLPLSVKRRSSNLK